MANNYSQFSETIDDITPEEVAWIERVLKLDCIDELEELRAELHIEGDFDFNDMWPHFDWALEGKDKSSLWLYCEEGFTEDHLTIFIREFINRFRPDFIMSITGSSTCSKPRVGEFGGWWLVISKDEVLGGNSWDEAQKLVEALKTGNFGPEID